MLGTRAALASVAAMVFATLANVIALAPIAHAEPPPLIPREVLLGNPERAEPTIAPDATRLAWLASDSNGVMQV